MDHAFDRDQAVHAPAQPQVRKVAVGAPIEWLRLGARDLHRSWGPSLNVGAAAAVAGLLLLAAGWRVAHLVPALLGGFLLVAPFAAVTIYGVTRQLETAAVAEGVQGGSAWRGNGQSIALFGLMLALVLIFWERIAAIVFAAFYRGEPLQWKSVLTTVLFSGEHLPMLLALVAAGAVVAAAVFAVSVVTVPLLVDRPVDVVTAAITSVQCCVRNPAAMLLWAALIALVTAVGLGTLMIGLVVVFPWLAHASWHAYRGMVVAP